jgi:hypothetical protein
MVADRFGNSIQCYSVLPPHQRPVITATCVVATSGTRIDGAPLLTPMERHDFSIASPYVPCTAALLAFARAYQVRTQATLEVWMQMRELASQQMPVAA